MDGLGSADGCGSALDQLELVISRLKLSLGRLIGLPVREDRANSSPRMRVGPIGAYLVLAPRPRPQDRST